MIDQEISCWRHWSKYFFVPGRIYALNAKGARMTSIQSTIIRTKKSRKRTKKIIAGGEREITSEELRERASQPGLFQRLSSGVQTKAKQTANKIKGLFQRLF